LFFYIQLYTTFVNTLLFIYY